MYPHQVHKILQTQQVQKTQIQFWENSLWKLGNLTLHQAQIHIHPCAAWNGIPCAATWKKSSSLVQEKHEAEHGCDVQLSAVAYLGMCHPCWKETLVPSKNYRSISRVISFKGKPLPQLQGNLATRSFFPNKQLFHKTEEHRCTVIGGHTHELHHVEHVHLNERGQCIFTNVFILDGWFKTYLLKKMMRF